MPNCVPKLESCVWHAYGCNTLFKSGACLAMAAKKKIYKVVEVDTSHPIVPKAGAWRPGPTPRLEPAGEGEKKTLDSLHQGINTFPVDGPLGEISRFTHFRRAYTLVHGEGLQELELLGF